MNPQTPVDEKKSSGAGHERINRVDERLYISDATTVRELPESHPFDRIITLGYFDRFGYERPSATTDEHVFPDGEHDYDDFRHAVDTVRFALESGHCVLVHCQAGTSRSVAVCAAALAVRRDIPLETAREVVRSAHPIANPVTHVLESAERYVSEAEG